MSALYKETDSYKVIESMTPAEVEMMVKVWESIKHTVNSVDPDRAGAWVRANDIWFDDIWETLEKIPGYAMSDHRDRKRRGFKYRSRAGFVRRVRKDLDKVRDWAMVNDDGNQWVRGVLKEVDAMVGYLPHNTPGEMDDEDAMFYRDSVMRVLEYMGEWKVENL